MMRYVVILFLLMNGLLPAHAQRVNTDAVVGFWQVVDQLERDRPLSDSLWNAYYHLPGNITYMDNNRGAEQAEEHRRYLELVFRPSRADSLRRLEEDQTKPNDDILDNLLYIKANERRLRSYTSRVISPVYLQRCMKLARRYIPKHSVRALPEYFTIYIMALTFDAAVGDSSMYFGIARVYEYDKYRRGAVAGHELHHQMRVERELVRPVSAADSAVFSAVYQINNEGSADLIDKMLLLENPGKIFRGASTVHRLMDSAARTIQQLDSCFKINAAETGAFVTARQFRKLMNYSSGHLPGLYMDQIIQRNGLERRLIRHDDDPFQFFYLYNEAAGSDPANPPVFSAEAMAYLKRLEKNVL
jgi:hypothetical protein